MKINKYVKKSLIEKIAKEIKEELKEDILNEILKQLNEEDHEIRHKIEDIIFSTRGEAEEILRKMYEILDKYGLVRVTDLYDLAGLAGNYKDNLYGWTNIRNSEVVHVRDGYIIKMPRAVSID